MRISNHTLRHGAALIDRTHRGRLRISGTDRRSYLQGLLTNDIEALTPGTGCYAAYLTPQGRMISDMRVFETGEDILMDLEGSRTAIVAERLGQFIFSEDVDVKDITASTADVGVFGPLAASVLRAVLGSDAPPDLERMPMLSVRRAPHHGSNLWIVRSDDVGVGGFEVILEPTMATALVDALRRAGAVDVDDETAEAARIEAGRPRYGVDMDEDTIPLEAGIEDRAISLTKGCYVGQEIIIRVLHRGHGRVARRLVHLQFEAGASVPESGQTIVAGEREIGRLTSATASETQGRPIALGYVHRDFAASGTTVSVGGRPATVVELPSRSAVAD